MGVRAGVGVGVKTDVGGWEVWVVKQCAGAERNAQCGAVIYPRGRPDGDRGTPYREWVWVLLVCGRVGGGM